MSIPLDPEEALRGLMQVDPEGGVTGEDMARKRGVNGLALRNLIRAHPELTPGHRWNEPYEITPEIEAKIVALPAFRTLPKL